MAPHSCTGLRGRGTRAASRALAAGIGVAAMICGAHAGADDARGEWFGSPVTGTKYVIERDDAARTKTLVAPDGRRFASVAAVLDDETRALTKAERVLTPELLAATRDPSRADELIDVTFLLRHQPAYDAGVAARARAEPALTAAVAREHAILDRIAPLRTFAGGQTPTVEGAMREESSLLSDDEKKTLRAARDEIHDVLADMRKEIFAETIPACERDQAPLAERVRSIAGAIDFGGSFTLNTRSARVPVREIARFVEDFPELLRVERIGSAQGQLDVVIPTIGCGSWWNATYNGNSNTLIAVLDTGIDTSHPALQNVVANSAIFLTAGVNAGNMSSSESTSSADDYQGHGTRAAGIVCSQDSTYRGVAYGGLLLNAKCGYLTNAAAPPTQTMQFADGQSGGDWAFTHGATACTMSFAAGGSGYTGTGVWPLFFDAASFSIGVPVALACRNDGPNSGTAGTPSDNFNCIACGAFDDNNTTSLSDDALATTSGRGPTGDGRQKPDLCGPGINITTTEYNWETASSFGTSLSGTSNVTPMVAGAYALIEDAGAAVYPAGMKALLLTTTRNTSPYGGPDNSWGYGALNCGAAYTYRASVYEGSLTSSGPRYVLLRGGALASGGRATLVWSRHVTSAGASTPTTYYPIQDLDLYVYDGVGGSQLGYSGSTIDTNEQVAVSAASSAPVYKVYRVPSAFTSSYSTEPFAVAAESATSTQLATPPTLACTFSQLASAVAGSVSTTIAVSVANSGTVKAFAPSVTLTLPSGYSVVSGTNPQTISDVDGQSSGTATWTVTTPSGPSGARTISAAASSTSYGDTFASATATASQTVDVDPPTGTVAIAGGAPYTSTRDVSVTLSASDALSGVAQMRVRIAGDAWPAWTAYATSVALTLPVGEGTKTVEAEFKDGAGNVSQTASDTIVYDATPPSGSVQVGLGTGYVNSESVTLTSAATDATSGVAESRFSNDGVNWGGWGAYAVTSAWTLVAGDGTRTVYAQYKDGAGNVSSTSSTTVVIERIPPTGSIVVAGGAAWTTSRTVSLSLPATDVGSSVHDMRFSQDGSAWTDWQSYAATLAWTLTSGDGQKTVNVQFRDAAGNISPTYSDGIGLDGTAPAGTVAIAGGARFATTTTVGLVLSATDALNGVAQMRFSNDFSTWSAWTTYAASTNWTLSAGEGQRFVYAQFMDGVGNISSPTSASVVVDTIPPLATMVVADDAAAVASSTVPLDLTWSDVGGSGATQARFSNDGAQWSAWVALSASIPWTMDAGDGPHTVYAQVRDAAGNVSATLSDAVVVDTVPPTGTFVLVGDAPYVAPWETLTADTTASDGPTGSGVAGFRTSADGGATWTEWAPIPADGRAVVPRPDASADHRVTIQGQFIDVAGNVSTTASDSIFVLADAAPDVTHVSSYVGTVGVAGDMDALRVQLVKGDKLSLKLAAKPLVKKSDVRVDVDVYGPDHAKLVTGRHPSTSKTAGVAKLEAPATGEYWIVLRASGRDADKGVGVAVAVSDAAAKGSRALKGPALVDSGAATIRFDAVEGMKLTGTLTVPVADAAGTPTLTAPDGTNVPVAVVSAKKGAVKILVPKLVGDAGTYVLTFPTAGPAKYVLSIAPTKPVKLLE